MQQRCLDLYVEPELVPIDDLLVPGAYVRSMLLPKGLKVQGAVKKEEYVTLLVQGSIVMHEAGKTKVYVAPCMFKSPSDQTRFIEAVELSVLVTVHGVKTTDINEVRAEVLV